MKLYYLTVVILLLLFGACSTTKNIPEGKYLLNNIEIKTDTKYASSSDLEAFSRQHPNGSIPLLGKLRLKIFNAAGSDTSRWITRAIQNLGEPPVIYNSSQTAVTVSQLQKELNNLGYLNAKVDTLLKTKGKKIDVTYHIEGGEPYTIRNYKYAVADTAIAKILEKNPFKTGLTEGTLFDMEKLEEERTQINTILRYVGYYDFSKEFLYFKADTTLNSNQVDLFLDIYLRKDSLPYSRYKINDVTIISGFNPFDTDSDNRRFMQQSDTTDYNNITIIRNRNKFLRTTTLYRNNYLRKGAYYSDYNYSRTYDAYNKMGAVKQVSISLKPSLADSLHLLDATISLVPANVHWFKASLDGTNSAGALGIAPSVAYQHQNLFNGSEQLSLKLKGAYEFITNRSNSSALGQNYYEIGGEIGLTFPQFLFPFLKKQLREWPSATTSLTVGLTTQHRQQYTRQFFNGTIDYGWMSKRNRLRHSLSFIDINYVRMPWVSDDFKNNYLDDDSNPLLKASYNDQLIARTSYSLTFTNGMRFNPLTPTYSLRTSVEVAGLLPRLASVMGGTQKGDSGREQIMGVDYAEYVKGSIDFAKTYYLDKKHSLAYHIGLGMAYPYGNSEVLPFERRFFAGGANSVRGWSTRALGPGAYRSNNQNSDFVNQTGDIKIEFSIEDRHKVSEYIELAAFVDAGNIWTLKSYESQIGGQFKFSEFYKEIAMSYGVGLRFDLGFLLLRLDAGARIYDPSEPQSDRFVMLQPRWRRAAWHFGIGYPF